MSVLNQAIPSLRLESKDWAGLTTANNLGAMFGEKPHEMSKLLARLESIDLGEDLYSKLMQYPTYEIEDDVEVFWNLQGADRKNVPLIKATTLSGSAFTATDEIGKGGQEFLMWFPEKYFFKTHVITGARPDAYKILIKSEGEQRGTAFVHRVQLLTGSDELYIPFEDLAAGTRWADRYSVSNQILSDTGSDISFTSPFRMANRMSMLRKKHVVSGDMIGKQLNNAYVLTSKTGSSEKTLGWINQVDMEFRRKTRREFAEMLWYGEGNRKADGTYGNVADNGYEIKTGMGLRQQISPSNTLHYAKFDLDALIDYCLQLSIGKLDMDSRKFVIGTGEQGLKMISRAIEARAGAAALDYTRQDVFTAVPGAGPNGAYGYKRQQFVQAADINGIRLEFMHIPSYDNQIINQIKHPDGGYAESHRLTIMDFGTTQGQPNIQLITAKNKPERFGYIKGFCDPHSPSGSTLNMATPLDAYEMHIAKWGGIMVHNPMRMGEWIPSVLA